MVKSEVYDARRGNLPEGNHIKAMMRCFCLRQKRCACGAMLIAGRARKRSVYAQQPRFRANALHLTLRVRLLAMSAAFDFRKCKRLLLSSLAVRALYRGPRGILCTRGEKEYASIRQPTAACDNRLVKREAYDVWPWLLCIVRTIYIFHNATIFPA